jgi:hypothetical protein
MNKTTLNTFKLRLQEELDKELMSKETFSEEMAEHIRNVYADLCKQREEWLKSKETNENHD